MKHLTFMVSALIVVGTFASCEKASVQTEQNKKHKVTFVVGTSDFAITKTRTSLSESNITELLVIDKVAGVQKQVIRQSDSDTDFGSPTLSLDYGTHTLTFIAHRSEGAAFDSESFTWSASRVRDTFILTEDIIIDTNSSTTRNVSVPRAVWQLKFLVNDALPDDLTKVRVVMQTYYGKVSLSSLNGLNAQALTRDFEIPASVLGTTGNYFSVFGFCPSINNEYTSDVSISFMRSDGSIIQSHSLSSIPLETNCVTTVSGDYFSMTANSVIDLNVAWGIEKAVAL
ncbi:MAG: hypothetical protein IJ557_02660 [Bacteroidaceae bacterium]|nr:hypothetical protein [Bacteroidaceae bacterium]